MADNEPERNLSLPRRGLILGATVLAAIALVGVGAMVGARLLDRDPPPATEPVSSPPPTPSSTSTEPPQDFVEFVDERSGFAIAYPDGWERLETDDPNVRLIAAGPGAESMLVRATRVGFDVKEGELDAVRGLTDKLVQAGKGVQVRAGPTQIELGGLPGYFYFYSFKDNISGKQGAHSHYFLFKDQTMISIVFQVIPLERFPEVAPLFDQIAATFRG